MKSDNIKRIIFFAAITAFSIAMSLPLFVLAARGTDETAFEGEKQYTAPVFSLSGFFSGSFAGDFNLWFSKNYPGRGAVLKKYYQLEYDVNSFYFSGSPDGSEPTTEEPTEQPTQDATEAPGYAEARTYTIDSTEKKSYIVGAGTYMNFDGAAVNAIPVDNFGTRGYVLLKITVDTDVDISGSYLLLGESADTLCRYGSNTNIYPFEVRMLKAGTTEIQLFLSNCGGSFGKALEYWTQIGAYRIALFNNGDTQVSFKIQDFRLVIPAAAESKGSIYDIVNKALEKEKPTETKGYRGDDVISVGKNGYLFTSAYVDEVFGLVESYRTVSYSGFVETAENLKFAIQELNKRGKALVFVISMSKAYECADFVGDWYLAQFDDTPEDYVRPVDKLRKALDSTSTYYVDSHYVCDRAELKNRFAKTGIHWNKPASFETVKAIISGFEAQTGRVMRRLEADSVITSKDPFPGGSSDKDIYYLVYDAITQKDAIVDELYFKPDAYVEDFSAKKINVFAHGGSFAGDIQYWFSDYGLSDTYWAYFYSTPQGSTPDVMHNPDLWEKVIDKCDLIIFECNELVAHSASSGDYHDLYAGLARYLAEHPAN